MRKPVFGGFQGETQKTLRGFKYIEFEVRHEKTGSAELI